MKKIILTSGLFVVLLSSFSAIAAEETICKLGNRERKIAVNSSDGSKSVSCNVKYFKENDKTGKVLWNSDRNKQFCETKSKEFAKKLGTEGWTCSTSAKTSISLNEPEGYDTPITDRKTPKSKK